MLCSLCGCLSGRELYFLNPSISPPCRGCRRESLGPFSISCSLLFDEIPTWHHHPSALPGGWWGFKGEMRQKFFFLVQRLHFYFLFSQSISVSALCPLERMQKRGLNNEIKASRFIPWCPWVHCDEIGCGDIWVGGVAAATGSFLQQFVEVTSLPAVKFAPFYLWMMLRKRKRFVSSFYQLYYI